MSWNRPFLRGVLGLLGLLRLSRGERLKQGLWWAVDGCGGVGVFLKFLD